MVQGGSLCITEKGVFCAPGYLSKGINQIMHSPAEDALLRFTSLGKISRLFSKTLQSQPHRAPARVVFFCFSNAAYDTPSLHPCCSFAWNSLPLDCHTATPLAIEVSAQTPSPQKALPRPSHVTEALSSATPGDINLPQHPTNPYHSIFPTD